MRLAHVCPPIPHSLFHLITQFTLTPTVAMGVSNASSDRQQVLGSPRSTSLARRISELTTPTHALTPSQQSQKSADRNAPNMQREQDTPLQPIEKSDKVTPVYSPTKPPPDSDWSAKESPKVVSKISSRDVASTDISSRKRPRASSSVPIGPSVPPSARPKPTVSSYSYAAGTGDYDELPLEVEYAFMNPTHFRSAITGRLRPDLLHTVLDPTSSFYSPVSANITHPVAKFLAGIPDTQTFCAAWGTLKVLMMCGTEVKGGELGGTEAGQQGEFGGTEAGQQGEWEEKCKVARHMTQYMGFILECSVLYTWESIARFHVRAMGPVFAAGALRAERWRGWDRGRDLIVLERLP